MNIIKTKFNPQIPLSKIEEFVENVIHWEKGSYGVMFLMFADREEFIFIDYPTDLNESQAEMCLDVFDDQIIKFNKENKPHPAVKPDIKVNSGALNLVLNTLRRAGKDEIADELDFRQRDNIQFISFRGIKSNSFVKIPKHVFDWRI